MINTRGRIRKDQGPFDYSQIENPEYRDLREEQSHASSVNDSHASDVSSYIPDGRIIDLIRCLYETRSLLKGLTSSLIICSRNQNRSSRTNGTPIAEHRKLQLQG